MEVLKSKKLTNEVLILTILHLLVDGICATTIFGALYKDNLLLPIIVFVGYNFLAFMMQPLIGLMIDTYKREKLLVLVSLLIVILGSLLGSIPYLSLVFLGLGNALFHTSAGKITIDNSQNKLSLLGIFVSLGVVGLTIGTLYASFAYLLLILISLTLLIGIGFYFINQNYQQLLVNDQQETKETFNLNSKNSLIIVGIIVIVMFRAIMGKYTVFTWSTSSQLILTTAIFIALGKAIGGIVADKIGIKWTIIISGLGSLVFLIFARDSIWGGLIGILLFNMTMPITLYLLYKMMPGYKTTAFGLAAMILFPGYVIGIFLQNYASLYNIILISITALTVILVIIFVREMQKKAIIDVI